MDKDKRGLPERLAISNDTHLLDEISNGFFEDADRYMLGQVQDALDVAQYSHSVNGQTGRLMVVIDDFAVPWNVAVRQQLLHVSADG